MKQPQIRKGWDRMILESLLAVQKGRKEDKEQRNFGMVLNQRYLESLRFTNLRQFAES